MNQNRFNLRTERTELTAAKSDWTRSVSRVPIGQAKPAQNFLHSYWRSARRLFSKTRLHSLQSPPPKKKPTARVPIGETLYTEWTCAKQVHAMLVFNMIPSI